MSEVTDVVVVGGGILGLFLALELSRGSLRVIVLEAERFGSGATGNGFAWINASSKMTNSDYHSLNASGLGHYRSLAAEFGEERIGWHGGGTLFIEDEEDGSSVVGLRERMETISAWNSPVCWLDSGEISALEPNLALSKTSCALFATAEGWIEPGRLVRFLIEQGKEKGVEYREFSKVVGFRRDRLGNVSVALTKNDVINTRQVALCAGVLNQEMLQLAFVIDESIPTPVFVSKSPGLIVEVNHLASNAQIERVLYPSSVRGFHLRPTSAAGLALAADDTDEDRTESSVAELISRARKILPAIPEGVAYTSRVCERPIPIDTYPLIGKLPHAQGFSLLASHSGITLAPTLAHLLAQEIISGEIQEKANPYRASRMFAN